jgi:hypothetical protein
MSKAEQNETFYPGPSRSHLAAFPPKERWNDWTELDSQAWPNTMLTTRQVSCERLSSYYYVRFT